MMRNPKRIGKICKNEEIGFFWDRNPSLCENEALDPRKGIFYALMKEENGNLDSDRQDFGGTVYSDFQNPGKFLGDSVYSIRRKPGLGQIPGWQRIKYTQEVRAPDRFLVGSV